MKKLATVEVIEVEEEGFFALIGQVITVFCMNYIYTGKLSGVNQTCILLEDPSLVYETGAFSSKDWKNAQKLPSSLYVQTAAIESFGIVK